MRWALLGTPGDLGLLSLLSLLGELAVFRSQLTHLENGPSLIPESQVLCGASFEAGMDGEGVAWTETRLAVNVKRSGKWEEWII